VDQYRSTIKAGEEVQAISEGEWPELAATDKRAARLAHISLRQLHYWDQTGLVVPSIKRRISQRNTLRGLMTFDREFSRRRFTLVRAGAGCSCLA
jgi:hypothetical protein